ncbi:MAG: YkgJ family cysteine cluster protein [Bacteroidota bacterium]
MNSVQPVNLRSFIQKALHTKRRMRRFLTRLENAPPKILDKKIAVLEKEVWKEVDCLSCANCCKTMTPRFNDRDIKRISAHFNMTAEEFKQKWLYRERGGDRDWLSRTEPCPFLELKTNKCSIYEIRPADCAGFPHFQKKFKDYSHVHKQNVECCPATHLLVQKMMERMNGNGQQAISNGQ